MKSEIIKKKFLSCFYLGIMLLACSGCKSHCYYKNCEQGNNGTGEIHNMIVVHPTQTMNLSKVSLNVSLTSERYDGNIPSINEKLKYLSICHLTVALKNKNINIVTKDSDVPSVDSNISIVYGNRAKRAWGTGGAGYVSVDILLKDTSGNILYATNSHACMVIFSRYGINPLMMGPNEVRDGSMESIALNAISSATKTFIAQIPYNNLPASKLPSGPYIHNTVKNVGGQ